MTSFGVVTGDVVADFELGFRWTREAATVKQPGFEAASKRFGMGNYRSRCHAGSCAAWRYCGQTCP
jgi:hypothetical protein